MVGCSAKSVNVLSAVPTTSVPQLVPLMSVDLHKRRAIEGIYNMFEYNVCIFTTLNMVALFFPLLSVFFLLKSLQQSLKLVWVQRGRFLF